MCMFVCDEMENKLSNEDVRLSVFWQTHREEMEKGKEARETKCTYREKSVQRERDREKGGNE